MSTEPSDLDPQKLWQGQAMEYDPMTLAAIHDKARTFQTRIRRRNALEYIGAAIAILGFLPTLLLRQSWMMQAGAAMIIVGVVFIVWQLHRRASANALPAAGEPLVDFYRTELIRQRDAVRSVGLWYLAPCVPGMVLLLLGRWFQVRAAHRSVGTDHLIIALMGGIAVLFFAVVWLLNQRGADRLQRRIDEL